MITFLLALFGLGFTGFIIYKVGTALPIIIGALIPLIIVIALSIILIKLITSRNKKREMKLQNDIQNKKSSIDESVTSYIKKTHLFDKDSKNTK